MIKAHTFHIPVMGLGYTIDTPIKISHFGIDSVISIVDDGLIEKIRKKYCEKNDIEYEPINDKEEDARARRITSYLNLVGSLAENKFDEYKKKLSEMGKEFKDYLSMLPENSHVASELERLKNEYGPAAARKWINENLTMGSIDVNIMTKLDKTNYVKDEKLPSEYNDAHAALRGFANSNLSSSIIFSAGMNPRLYSYLEKFNDFYPDAYGRLKKKIVLKVSDFRSALIQGKFLAKKGLWVSEYRIESGLNCGGHAFATDGHLLGPILEEFKEKKNSLIETMFNIFTGALEAKKKQAPASPFPLSITAQGGVGTAEEHDFLLKHYRLDSVGWGTPFLLSPDVTSVDEETRKQLSEALEKDLYLSNISPLGVPFNSMRGNSMDVEKARLIKKGRPGSSCPKKFLAINNREFSERDICTASRQYQYNKLKELDSSGLTDNELNAKTEKVTDKACLCVGLGTSALKANGIELNKKDEGVSVCPGPNLAYFSKITGLKDMIGHIYGRMNIMERDDRPHMFIKELGIYINYLKDKITEAGVSISDKEEKYFRSFAANLNEGIDYYNRLFTEMKGAFEDKKESILHDLEDNRKKLDSLIEKINKYNLALSV